MKIVLNKQRVLDNVRWTLSDNICDYINYMKIYNIAVTDLTVDNVLIRFLNKY